METTKNAAKVAAKAGNSMENVVKNSAENVEEKAAKIAAQKAQLEKLEAAAKAAKAALRELTGTAQHKSRAGAGVTMKERVAFLDSFINAKKHTRKELVEMLDKKFVQCTHAANATIISDGFNAKYTKFGKVLTVNEKGIVMYKS